MPQIIEMSNAVSIQNLEITGHCTAIMPTFVGFQRPNLSTSSLFPSPNGFPGLWLARRPLWNICNAIALVR